MANFLLTNKAVDDLSEIWNYTFEEWSENQADKYYFQLLSDCKELARNQNLGKNYSEISKEIFTSDKLIFASGIKDIMPKIKGFSESWGISVLHCPYCHGYEVKNEKIALLMNGDHAFDMADQTRRSEKPAAWKIAETGA